MHDSAVHGTVAVANLPMQREDACTCKTCTTARCKAPWRWAHAMLSEDASIRWTLQHSTMHGIVAAAACSAHARSTQCTALLLVSTCGAERPGARRRRCPSTNGTRRVTQCTALCYPWVHAMLRDTLRCKAAMLASARRPRQRGARHRGGGQTLRSSAKMPALTRRS